MGVYGIHYLMKLFLCQALNNVTQMGDGKGSSCDHHLPMLNQFQLGSAFSRPTPLFNSFVKASLFPKFYDMGTCFRSFYLSSHPLILSQCYQNQNLCRWKLKPNKFGYIDELVGVFTLLLIKK